jgi:hypothetical protein
MMGWIVNTARNMLWRVPSWYSLEDLVGDGLFCFTKCRARYIDGNAAGDRPGFPVIPGQEEKKHFMRLVQVAFLNHISTLAARGTSDELYDDIDDSLWPADALVTDEEASLAVTLQQLPAELQQLLLILAKDGVRFLRFGHRRRLRETGRQQLNRVMKTENIDWMKCIREELS